MPIKYIGVKVPEDMEKRIRAHARDRDIPMSDVVKEALYRFFQGEADAERTEWMARELETALGVKIDALGKQIAGLLDQIETNG
jgi:hypothetical protein